MKAAALLLAFLTALTAPFAPGVADGRDGNRALAAGDSTAAATAYRLGLATAAPRWVRARLNHNLGLALVGADPATADSVLAAAVTLADDPADRARFAHHAGLAALAADAPGRAVAHLRRALLLDPANRAAQRAYEIARRRMAGDDAPTAEAQQIQAEAARLVAARRYADALALMTANRERVPSLAAFDDWTGRLAGVVGIVDGRTVPADTSAAPLPVLPP